MADIYHDRYRKTVPSSAPGDNVEYSHQCTPDEAGDVLLGASAYVHTWDANLAVYSHRFVAVEIADTPTWGDGNVAYAYYKWDDGMGGADVPGTAYLTCIFAKVAQL